MQEYTVIENQQKGKYQKWRVGSSIKGSRNTKELGEKKGTNLTKRLFVTCEDAVSR